MDAEKRTISDTRDDNRQSPEPEIVEKAPWTKPEIVSFKPVTAARGVSFMIGDGISNLS
jgi:hypothetical protein